MSPEEIAALHKAMIRNYAIGQRVRALTLLGDCPNGDSPGGVYARPGEILIVRQMNPALTLPIAVSHEDIFDKSFRVAVNEIEVVDE